ncbi:MAG: alpha/beta fold hydrolase [Alphaproteobacteria bacterium]|nr:alpha/beta fold hydrolase [Alphaproteobacteria bacterium]
MFTLVFIPGLLLTRDLFADQSSALGANYPVHHAVTTGMDSITAMAQKVLDDVSGPIIPIGLSMGGYVTLELARLAPDRLSAMVVMDSNAETDGLDKRTQRQALIELSQHGKFKGVTRSLLPNFIAPHHLDNPDVADVVMAMTESVGRENFTLQQTAIMTRRDQFDTLRAWAKPSLFMVGELDTLTPPQMVLDMADATRGSHYVEIANAGHLPTVESPDDVTVALTGFLERL